MNKIRQSNKHSEAFTIVELLVVIVVIGILAAITIVSYSGISNKAIAASLQSDLSNDVKLLKMYNIEYGYYPSAIDGTTYCPTAPNPDTRYCLKASQGTTLAFTGGAQAFKVKVTKNGMMYYATEGTAIAPVTVPIVDFNTATSITATTATLGATIVSDGGDDVTAYGVCYGTTASPTNCVEVEQGMLTAATPATKTVNYAMESVVSPDGKHVYVITNNNVGIFMFSRDAVTGALTALSTASITAGYYGESIAISPDGKFVYAGSQELSNSSYIQMFSRDSTTGLLTALSPKTYDLGAITPNDIKVSPDGKYIYFISDDGYLYRYTRNTTTGLITAQSANLNGAGYGKNLDLSPDGKHAYRVDSVNGYVRMYSVNSGNGDLAALTPAFISSGGGSYFPRDIVVSPDGKNVYAINQSSGLIMYSRDSSTGLLTALGAPNNIGVGTSPWSMTISADGKSVYVTSDTRISMYFRDSTTGRLAALSTANLGNFTSKAVTISPDGKSVYTTNNAGNNLSVYNRAVGATVGATFTKAITGLTAGTTYYYRGFATNGVGTGYSADSTFSTP